MKTYRERIERERNNLSQIIIYSDGGLFCNVYERSAYAFYTNIKPFKVHVKTLKGLEHPYVTLGFPVKSKDEYFQVFTLTEENLDVCCAALKTPIDEAEYQKWKDKMIAHAETTRKVAQDNNSLFHDVACEDMPLVTEHRDDDKIIRQCFQEVKALNIASITPMEAMLYLNNLQQKLKNISI